MIGEIIELVALLCSTVALVVYYSDAEVKLYVKVIVAFSWVTSFLIILILPIDISSTLKGEELLTIKRVWASVYYVNFIFTWLILPIIQHYEDAGEFTWKGKLKRSLVNNGIMIAVFLVLGVFLIIYLAVVGKFSIDLLPAIFATIANVFGIILVIIFLGHGLISLPKHFYLRSSNTKTLAHNYQTASLLSSKLQDLDFEIDVELRKVYHLQTHNDPLISSLASKILQQIPSEIKAKKTSKSKAFDLLDAQTPTQKTMIDLSQQIKKKIREYQMHHSWLQEIVEDTQFVNSQTEKNNYLYLKIFYISLLVITIFLSTVIFIGEISSFVPAFEKANILIYIDKAKSPVSYVLNSMLLLYMTYIITHSIFEMNVFGLFNLHKRHSTAASLLFMAINVARISYPLCYNYLQITGMPEIAFLQFFGEIQIGGNNAYVFPILLIIFGVFNLLSIYDRVMACLGLGRFAFSGEDSSTEEGGKSIIQKLIKKSQDTTSRLSSASSSKSKNGAYLQLGQF